MPCLSLEAIGIAEPGKAWQLAETDEILREGKFPICTMGGLKGRGHPIGATALYQVHEIFLQMQGMAGKNQIKKSDTAFMQSIGGAGTSIFSHIFAKRFIDVLFSF